MPKLIGNFPERLECATKTASDNRQSRRPVEHEILSEHTATRLAVRLFQVPIGLDRQIGRTPGKRELNEYGCVCFEEHLARTCLRLPAGTIVGRARLEDWLPGQRCQPADFNAARQLFRLSCCGGYFGVASSSRWR